MILLLRHGSTPGNLEKRYIGRTDEPLSIEGRESLSAAHLPKVQRVISSPMRRCLETAAVLYPGMPVQVVPDFREVDFGVFEGKNHAELNGNAAYQTWIDSGGTLAFPGGEGRDAFSARCVAAYEKLCNTLLPDEDAALIVHGGTLMAILAAYALPKRDYFDYQAKNGCGYLCGRREKTLVILEKITCTNE